MSRHCLELIKNIWVFSTSIVQIWRETKVKIFKESDAFVSHFSFQSIVQCCVWCTVSAAVGEKTNNKEMCEDAAPGAELRAGQSSCLSYVSPLSDSFGVQSRPTRPAARSCLCRASPDPGPDCRATPQLHNNDHLSLCEYFKAELVKRSPGQAGNVLH